MKLWDKRSELVISNLKAYLYTTVKNRCVNYIQGCITRRRFWEYYRTFLPNHENQTDRIVDYNELNNFLEQSLNAIPEKSKLIFKLSRFEGLSVREIASKLNLSEKPSNIT